MVSGLQARIETARTESHERAMYAALYVSLWNSAPTFRGPRALGLTTALDRRLQRWVDDSSDSAPMLIRNTLRSHIEPIVNRRAALESQQVVWMATGGSLEQKQAASELTRYFEGFLKLSHGSFGDASALFRHGVLLAAVATGSVAVFPRYVPGREAVELELDDTLELFVGRGRPGGAPREVVRHWQATAASLEDEYEAGLPEGDPDRLVDVYEGWLAASRDRCGRHTVAIVDGSHCELLEDDDTYDREALPLALLHVSPPLGTEWALPLSHHVRVALMLESQALSDWADALHKLPAFLITVPQNSVADPAALETADNIQVIETKGNASAGIQVTPVARNSGDALAMAASLREGSLDVLGVSEQAVRGDRAEGTRSGKHEAHVAALNTERQAALHRDIIQWRTVDVARATLLVLQDAIAADRSMRAVVAGDRRPRRLALEQIDLSGVDAFALRAEPVSEEVASPRARRETLEAQRADGTITLPEYLMGLQHLDAVSGGADAELVSELTQQLIEGVYRGEPPLGFAPPPGIGLPALQSMQKDISRAYLRSLVDGEPDHVQASLVDLLEIVGESMAAAAREAAALAPPPSPALPGSPV